MTFKQWVLMDYINKNTPRGDFAKDVKRDLDFPDTDDFNDILSHLKRVKACSDAKEMFKRMYKDYCKTIIDKGVI